MTGRGRAANTGTEHDDVNGEGYFEGPILWSTLLLPDSSPGIQTEIPNQTHHDDRTGNLYPAVDNTELNTTCIDLF